MVKEMDNSNIAPISATALIKQEAGAWIAKIDQGPLSPAQIDQLQQWIAQSHYHRQYLEKLARNWDAMGILQELAPLFPINSNHSSATPDQAQQAPASGTTKARWTTLNWRGPAMALSLAMVTLLTLVLSQWQPNQFQTQIGEQASYQLPDGTTVFLNTNSQVSIDYSSDRRAVRLIKGEAHFTVAKNPQRPFMVYAGDGMVWAVGTAFNVRYLHSAKQAPATAPATIDVTVTEGRVKVFAQLETPASNAHKPAQQQREQLVDAGNSVQYSTQITKAPAASPIALEQKLAWQKGALVFKGETLQQALAEIARYTAKDLIITDPSIASIRVGGHYKTDNIDSLLVALGHSFGIRVQLMDNNSIELSAKN